MNRTNLGVLLFAVVAVLAVQARAACQPGLQGAPPPTVKLTLGERLGFCPCDIDSLTVYGRALNAKEIAARAAETAE